MKISSNLVKYLFLFSLTLGITNKTLSPDIKSYTGYTLSELDDIRAKKKAEEREQFIIDKLEKPVPYFYIPVSEGQISCVYGLRKVKGKWEFHKGIDIGVKWNASVKVAGTPDIFAIAPGIVSFAGTKPGYGKFVEIEHAEGLKSKYGHLSEYFVKEGDTVLPPLIIGKMGRTGKVRSNKKGSKIHLHFEIERDGKHFDAAEYFRGYKRIGIDDIVFSMNYLPTVEIVDSLPRAFSDPGLYYGVQIAALLKPLSQKRIGKLEKLHGYPIKEGKMKVYKNGKGTMYYKYSIGNYKTLEEVLTARKSINSKDNLGIVVYKNNKIVETKWNL